MKSISHAIAWHKSQIRARTEEYNNILKNPSQWKNPKLLMSSRLFFIRHHYDEIKLLLEQNKLQQA